jgi:predicted  nucleic acid-binding Zn-ribbon protein
MVDRLDLLNEDLYPDDNQTIYRCKWCGHFYSEHSGCPDCETDDYFKSTVGEVKNDIKGEMSPDEFTKILHEINKLGVEEK